MLKARRIATLGVITVAAIVPAVGAQAANAGPHNARLAPAELCHPKWVLPPVHPDLSTDDPFDTHQHSSPRDASETVANEDLTYDGC